MSSRSGDLYGLSMPLLHINYTITYLLKYLVWSPAAVSAYQIATEALVGYTHNMSCGCALRPSHGSHIAAVGMWKSPDLFCHGA